MGYDAGKKVKGRKIHAPVGSEGLPMRAVIQSAAVQERDDAGLVLATGPKAEAFLEQFCEHKVALVKADGKDILRVVWRITRGSLNGMAG